MIFLHEEVYYNRKKDNQTFFIHTFIDQHTSDECQLTVVCL